MIIEQINNIVVNPIVVKKFDVKKVKGGDLFPNPYCNIFLCAKKNSGKTNVINTILRSSFDSDTKIFIFCPTVDRDDTWIKIVEYFKEIDIEVETFQSICDNKFDILKEIIPNLEKQSIEKTPTQHIIKTNQNKDKKPLSKLFYPKYIFVFDDIGNELSCPSVEQLLKTNRHYRSRVIISSQNVNDLRPASRKQIDYWLLFAGHQTKKLETIFIDADPSVDFNTYTDMYYSATNLPYSFFYMDVRTPEFRINFNQKFLL